MYIANFFSGLTFAFQTCLLGNLYLENEMSWSED